jgi:hypothetical protein
MKTRKSEARAQPAKTLEALLKSIAAAAFGKVTAGASAARSQDFLYDDNGLPE